MQYWAEDIDVKDIVLFIENEDKYHLSFLVKKYHDDVFVKEHNLDTLLDEINQSRIDYGAGLIMDIGEAKPQVINLEEIAFCNQSDMLSSPLGLKFYMSPNELQDMEDRGWGDESKGATHTIEEVISLSRSESSSSSGNSKEPVKGKYVQVYVITGYMPQSYLDDSDSEEYVYQRQVICFYKSKDTNGKDLKQGVTLLAL